MPSHAPSWIKCTARAMKLELSAQISRKYLLRRRDTSNGVRAIGYIQIILISWVDCTEIDVLDLALPDRQVAAKWLHAPGIIAAQPTNQRVDGETHAPHRPIEGGDTGVVRLPPTLCRRVDGVTNGTDDGDGIAMACQVGLDHCELRCVGSVPHAVPAWRG